MCVERERERERERGITKYLGNEFETFVDPFHPGCHGGSSKTRTNATESL